MLDYRRDPDGFDLFRNPFIVLGVTPSDTADKIAEAVQDAIADKRMARSELNTARQALLVPNTRTEAEVTSLLDSPAEDWRPILTALRSSQDSTKLLRSFDQLGPISKSNLIAHLAGRNEITVDLICSWIQSSAEIEVDRALEIAAKSRKAAGMVPPTRVSIMSSLEVLVEKHCRAIVDKLARTKSASATLRSCIERMIPDPGPRRLSALTSVVQSYREFIKPALASERERIVQNAEILKAHPDRESALKTILAAVKEWESLSNPLRVLENHKARDDADSKEVYFVVRGLAVDLANEHKAFDSASKVLDSVRGVAALMPGVKESFAEDEKTLKEQLEGSSALPLFSLLDELTELGGIADELKRNGFNKHSEGAVGKLWSLFSQAALQTKGTEAAKLPWLAMRQLSIRLNNELKEPDVSVVLLDALLAIAPNYSLPDEIVSLLTADRRSAERNELHRQLDNALGTTKNFSEASRILEKLLEHPENAEEETQLRTFKEALERQRVRKLLKWAFWIFVGGVGLLIALNEPSRPPSKSTYRPQTDTAPQRQPPPTRPEPVDLGNEERPPVGSDLTLSTPQIRYCEFQDVRLEYLRPRLQGSFEISSFNEMIGDFNSRCAKYRFLTRDRTRVIDELPAQRTKLQGEAQRILDSWRTRQTSPAPQLPRTPPPQTAPPSPESVEDRFSRQFAGAWATSSAECLQRAQSFAYLRISAQRIETGNVACSVTNLQTSGTSWTLNASCRNPERTWQSKFTLTRSGNMLELNNERTSSTYFRCASN